MPTVRDVTDRASVTLDDLAQAGEAVEDEWQYVVDLGAAWHARLDEVAAARGSEPIGPEVLSAVERAVAEAALIEDPHRAIDWLSTFPQIVLLALGEPA